MKRIVWLFVHVILLVFTTPYKKPKNKRSVHETEIKSWEKAMEFMWKSDFNCSRFLFLSATKKIYTAYVWEKVDRCVVEHSSWSSVMHIDLLKSAASFLLRYFWYSLLEHWCWNGLSTSNIWIVSWSSFSFFCCSWAASLSCITDNMCVQVNLHVMQCLLGQLYKAPVTYLTQCEEWISHRLCTVPHERRPPEKTESEIFKNLKNEN